MDRTHVKFQIPLGEIKDLFFSFENPLVLAHFKFASEIFDMLGEVNEIFQRKYGFINYHWEYLVTLFKFFVRELQKLQNNDFSRFEYLALFDQEKRDHFTEILKNLILNLKVRFLAVSFSLNKKSIGPFLDYQNMMILNGAHVGDLSRCGVSPMLELFNVKQTQVTQHLSITLPHLDVGDEWKALVPLFTTYGHLILRQTDQRSLMLSGREKDLRSQFEIPTITNLIDVFGVIPKSYFPSLWNFVVRLLTIIPTTVACEQSFSYFKRTFHSNMAEGTAKIFLMVRLKLYENCYNL